MELATVSVKVDIDPHNNRVHCVFIIMVKLKLVIMQTDWISKNTDYVYYSRNNLGDQFMNLIKHAEGKF